jgi:two-component system, chemotaxis family, protein-glutamate methylesterase/glutaminase
MKYEAIVMGASAGGLLALSGILETLPADFPLPVIIVQHRLKSERALLEEVLQSKCRIRIREADEKETPAEGTVYLAPPGYHLLVEKNRSLSLSCEPPLHFSRPSIDILFETASEAYGKKLIGIILTGANNDGAAGMQSIRKHGGMTIAQNPASAQFPVMPQAAIAAGGIQYIFDLQEIRNFLSDIPKKHSLS